ncbi:MAG: hypothetical protein KGL48_04415 [Sphingomonadales bacterium]|nr:hypothetical protein [Sphingomonadales bacterium]MDE2567471.1 hypothetical protein [Sphingomonadales bacterium]
MRKLRTALVAGFATLGLAGTALAATHDLHVMNVNLPDGSVARIAYAGKVAPTVKIEQPVAVPVDFTAAFPDPVIAANFAGLDRMAAMMDAQSQAMMEQVAAMEQAARNQMANAHFAAANARTPANGSWSYTVMTSSNGKDACTQTVSWSSDSANAQPRVQRTSAGDCDTVKQHTAPVPAAVSKPAPKPVVNEAAAGPAA